MTATAQFMDMLTDGVVIFDGAMGTEIYRRNVQTFRCFDELNVSEPDLIRGIHQDYCDAGADVMTTNTFGANRLELGRFGMAEQLEAINKAGVQLAREVADKAERPVFVAGSVGPILPKRPKECDKVATLKEQVLILAEAGVDLILFETQRTRKDLELCARAMKDLPDMAFALFCTIFADCESAAGESVKRILRPMPEGVRQPILWGFNCSVGPDALLEAAEKAVKVTDAPLALLPNAGFPRELGGRMMYFSSPDYIAGYAQHYLNLGISGIGGCCGTTPEHIAEIAQRIKPLATKPKAIPALELATGAEAEEATPFAEKSRFAWKLANKKWVATVEIVPPRSYDLSDTLTKAHKLYRQGVDAINLPDGPRASARLSPLVTAARVQQEAQIEPILHFCCRDRNLIGMQADLLACAACQIRNILFVTGDPPKLGNYPHASGVFDADSIGLCHVQAWLNRGIDIGGQSIKPRTHTVIGVGADPTALDMEREVARFIEKAQAGAEFAITQPVFDPDALFRFLDRVKEANLPVLAGVWPLASYRNATFLQNEIPGVVIPDAVMERMQSVNDREAQRMMGVSIAREMVARIRDRVAGIQVSAPFGNIDTALAVILD